MGSIEVKPSKEMLYCIKFINAILVIFNALLIVDNTIFIGMIPIVLLGILGLQYNLYKITFNIDNIIFKPTKNKIKIYAWRDLKTIRYEQHYYYHGTIECIYFSPNLTKKPKFIDPTLISFLNRNVFFVQLLEKTDPTIGCSYSKYEFLDKLYEWGIEIEIAEKYLQKDSRLRKYAKKKDKEQQIDMKSCDNEWIIDIADNKHIISYKEDKEDYNIIVDGNNIKSISKKKVWRYGLEEAIVLDNEKYLLVYDNKKFGVVKDGRYIHNNKKYISRKIEWTVLIIGMLMILSSIVIGIFDIIKVYKIEVMLILNITSLIMLSIFKHVKRG